MLPRPSWEQLFLNAGGYVCLIGEGTSETACLDGLLYHPHEGILVGLRARVGICVSSWLMQSGKDGHRPVRAHVYVHLSIHRVGLVSTRQESTMVVSPGLGGRWL